MNKLINCPAVILCGGKSSRMQEDKSLLPFGGYSTLAEYQYKKLQNIFTDVYLSSKEDKFEFLEDKSKLILDHSRVFSPMIALQNIFKHFENQYLFITAVDIPLLKEKTIDTLYNTREDSTYEIIVPIDKEGNRHNLCGFYHSSLITKVEKLLEKDIHKIGALFSWDNSITIEFEDMDQLLNINNKQSYKQGCELYKNRD